jgi:hypothetical protein
VRTLLVAVAALAVLVVLAIARSAYDDGPTPEQRRCDQLRAAANAVPEREDTVADEEEYHRLDAKAERACRGT